MDPEAPPGGLTRVSLGQASKEVGVLPRDMAEPPFLAAITEREARRREQEPL